MNNVANVFVGNDDLSAQALIKVGFIPIEQHEKIIRNAQLNWKIHLKQLTNSIVVLFNTTFFVMKCFIAAFAVMMAFFMVTEDKDMMELYVAVESVLRSGVVDLEQSKLLSRLCAAVSFMVGGCFQIAFFAALLTSGVHLVFTYLNTFMLRNLLGYLDACFVPERNFNIAHRWAFHSNIMGYKDCFSAEMDDEIRKSLQTPIEGKFTVIYGDEESVVADLHAAADLHANSCTS